MVSGWPAASSAARTRSTEPPVSLADMLYLPAMEPLALYIHWPFCLAKCPYCDFNSHVRERIPQARFRDALRRELAWEAERLGRRTLTSIFFGGGTPSLMEPETVADADRRCAPPVRTGGRHRDHAGGQSDQRRGRPLRGIPRRRREPRLDRRAEPRPGGAADARPAAFGGAGDRRAGDGAGDVPAHLVRSDLRAARPDARCLAGGTAPGARAGGGSSVALPAHDRAGHEVRGDAPPRRHRAAGRGHRAPRCTRRPRRRQDASASLPTRCRTTPCQAAKAGTISPTGAMATTPASARRAWQDYTSRVIPAKVRTGSGAPRATTRQASIVATRRHRAPEALGGASRARRPRHCRASPTRADRARTRNAADGTASDRGNRRGAFRRPHRRYLSPMQSIRMSCNRRSARTILPGSGTAWWHCQRVGCVWTRYSPLWFAEAIAGDGEASRSC